MFGIREFVRDTKGGLVERVALMAGAISLASLGSAHMLDVASRDTNSNLYAFFSVKQGLGSQPGAGASPGIDYTPTATIRKQAGQVLLDPCTGKPK